MNCFNHHELSAVAQCEDCSKGLCKDCARRYSIPICSACNVSRGGNERSNILKELFWTYGLGVGLTLMVSNAFTGQIYFGCDSLESNLVMLMMFYAYSGLIAGWYTLNRLTPRFFLILPLIGWVIYFSVKTMIAGCVGIVMLPIRTFRNLRRLKQLKSNL